MRSETAISLLMVVTQAVLHRETCIGKVQGDLPLELLTTAFETLDADGIDASWTRAWLAEHGIEVPRCTPAPYRRRANNQVSAEVEALIRDLLERGWTKTAIANHLKVNRRVVIRVAREAQCAHNTRSSVPNDLGKSRS